jgi:dTDP-4-amino-4,6-dideoxygalactose transaminase
VKHVIPCANGTDALQIAMMGLDLKPVTKLLRLILRCCDCGSDCFMQLTPVLVDVDLYNEYLYRRN